MKITPASRNYTGIEGPVNKDSDSWVMYQLRMQWTSQTVAWSV